MYVNELSAVAAQPVGEPLRSDAEPSVSEKVLCPFLPSSCWDMINDGDFNGPFFITVTFSSSAYQGVPVGYPPDLTFTLSSLWLSGVIHSLVW